jgi:hypothetical protein
MSHSKDSTTRRTALAAGLSGLAVFLLCWLIVWWTRPPQMGVDEEAIKIVDALFTAVTARDQKLLGQCEQRLHACTDAGTLPPAALAYLDKIIQTAHDGRWESAARSLYDFIRAQRREGPRSPRHQAEKTRKSSTK